MPGSNRAAWRAAAVWNLFVPTVIRPHRDGWLTFMRGRHAWCGTAKAAADALLAGEHRNSIPIKFC
jgi:hypothetical protein